MLEHPGTTRRTAVRTIAAICVGAFSLSMTGTTVATTADAYVATVDRIVDGAHVVLLLEDDGELVDQHVTPREDLPDVEESDTLLVVIANGELTYAREIESNAIDRARERFDCLAEPLDR